MALVLTIENEQSLPNGAPVSVRLTEGRGIDIGRSATTDWSLPDPTRFISGRHCEVRYRDDGYWLNDLSTNGTFLNDSTRRIQAPYKLRHGDRLAIGSYIITVAIEPDEEAEAEGPGATDAGADLAAASLDAQIAEAIASETAPPRPEPLASATSASGSAAGILQAEQPPREKVPPQRPFTMVRARGFFAAPPHRPPDWQAVPPPAEREAPPLPGPPAAAPPHSEAPPEANGRCGAEAPGLDAHELEALAWSAPERTQQAAAAAPARANLWDEAQIPQGDDFPAQEPWPAASPAAPAAAPLSATAGADEFLQAFAKGAGVPPHIFARQDGLKVAEELGALMRMAVDDLTQLLSARFKAKRFARTSSQTMIQALDNNPLKFAPTPDEALKIMFGPRTSSYLDARRAFEGAFTDLKAHQINTFAAMQQAVRMLVEDLDPNSIEAAAGEDRGLAALFGAHKARLWDLYLARWQAKTLRHEDGLVDAFMLYFAQCYDQAKESK